MTNVTNNGNLQIIRVPQSRLLKKEMADYAEMTIGVVKKHDHEKSMFSILYNKLVERKRYIEILRIDYGIDAERMKIDKRKNKLSRGINTFKSTVIGLKFDKPDIDFFPLDNAINQHFRYLYKAKNDKDFTQKVAGFFDVVEKNEEVLEIITQLNLLEDIMKLDTMLKSFIKAVEKRIELLSQRPNIKTQNLTKVLAGSIENLHKAIEVAYLISLSEDGDTDPDTADTVDYEALIGELNELNSSYNRSINIRMHNNRRKAEQKKLGMEQDGGADDADDTSDEDELEMQAASLYYDDELDDELEGELSDELNHDLDGAADD